MDQQPTTDSHGRLSPWRWDTTTAAGALTVGAVLFLIFVGRVAFSSNVSGSVGGRIGGK